MLSYCVKFLGSRIQCKVAAFNLSPLDTHKYPPEVKWKIDQNSKKEHLQLAQDINDDPNVSAVVIQHEYGIFGGPEGEKILHFMRNCQKPLLVTLHTVLPSPPQKMKEVTENIVQLAHTLVVLTKNSKILVEKIYPESKGKVFVIPHGIHPTSFSFQKTYKKKLELENHTILSTFGLLSQGKGIEYVIQALPEVVKKYPSVLYLILGGTHPVVRRKEGEKYRISLAKLVTKLKLKKNVKFYDQYLSLDELFEFLKATDLYISTSTNPNQAVSGTLSYALGTGRPVISTQFSQSKEMVTPDIGRLIPIKNSPALTSTLLDLLSDSERLKKMSHTAYEKTRVMLWSHVAEEYMNLITRAVVPPFKIDHLKRMTDEFGLFQFATLAVPNTEFGYTLDDNARALILCSWLVQKKPSKEISQLINTYFFFIQKCFQKNGSFINYVSFKNKIPTLQNKSEDLEDAHARAIWALAEIMQNIKISLELRNQATQIFLKAWKKSCGLTHIRAKAFAIKAFSLAQKALPKKQKEIFAVLKIYADDLVSALGENSSQDWTWFENRLQYNNGLLPESLLIAGEILKNSSYTEKGLLTLQFLIQKTFSSNMYRPIGHSHWYKNKKKRSHYDQQPEDPASMMLALTCAYECTQNEEYKNLAQKCFTWFLGNNTLNLSLYDETSGGCYDGLHPDRVNLNQGAESLISFLMSSYLTKELP